MEIDLEFPSGRDKKLDDSIQSHAMEENVDENVDRSGNGIEIQGGSTAKSSKRKKVQQKCKVQSSVEVLSTRIQDSSLQMVYLLAYYLLHIHPGTRMAAVAGYYAPHQRVHGLGQLSLFSMLQDRCCSNRRMAASNYVPSRSPLSQGNLNYVSAHGGHYSPQSIQGLGQLSFRALLLQTSFDIPGNSSDMDNTTSVTGKHLQD
ncbi:hypothetical protein K7X08_005933 [Anisodus acutangulus]|uniref:Uncharacterized protein n=1 Tax=Anisodus acutangulus TaxID=402998 RepID=A0A9Q1R8N4_9SOLA|nr:hypothetical protein K7X08_005933 [Anisodus acutangulus]